MTDQELDSIDTIENDIERFESENDTTALVAALADAVAAIAGPEDGDHEQYLDRLAQVHDDEQTFETARAYARGVEHAVSIEGENGDFDSVASRIQTLRELHEEFREKEIVVHLATGLVEEAKYNQKDGDPGEAEANLQFIDNLSREYPGEALSKKLAAALKWAIRASWDQNDYDDVRRKSDRLEGLYQQYPSDEMAYYLYDGSHPKFWVACVNDEYDKLASAIERGKELLEEHDHDDLPARIAHHYRNMVMEQFGDDDPRKGRKQFEQFESFYETHRDSEGVPNFFGEAVYYAAEHYLDNQEFEEASEWLDRLFDLHEEYADTEASVADSLSDALEAAVNAHTQAGSAALAQERFEELQSLAETDPDEVGDSLASAVRTRAEQALSADDQEQARELAALLADGTTAAERRVYAQLQTQLNLAAGRWGFNAEETTVTVESETDSEVVLHVTDVHGLEQLVSISDDRYCKTITGEKDIPEEWSDLTPVQRRWVEFMRGHAYHWTMVNTDLIEYNPKQRLDQAEATLDAVRDLSLDAFEAAFGTYVDQHASHFADETPFMNPVERPISLADIDQNGREIWYELYIERDDDGGVSTSDIQIRLVEDTDSEIVREIEAPDGENYGWLSMQPRMLFDSEQAKTVIENQLARICRDRYVDYAREPPEKTRLLGSGHYRVSESYAEYDVLPDFHDSQADVPGYERGVTDQQLLAAQFSDRVYEQFGDTARTVRDAFDTPPEPTIEAPETTHTGDH